MQHHRLAPSPPTVLSLPNAGADEEWNGSQQQIIRTNPKGLTELKFPAELLKTTHTQAKSITNSSTPCLSTAAKLSVKLLHCDHREVRGGSLLCPKAKNLGDYKSSQSIRFGYQPVMGLWLICLLLLKKKEYLHGPCSQTRQKRHGCFGHFGHRV